MFVKAASASGTRSMNLFMNGFQFARITANATDNPRPTGTEFGSFLVEIAPGDNTLELKDDLGTADVLQMRTNNPSRTSPTSRRTSRAARGTTIVRIRPGVST